MPIFCKPELVHHIYLIDLKSGLGVPRLKVVIRAVDLTELFRHADVTYESERLSFMVAQS